MWRDCVLKSEEQDTTVCTVMGVSGRRKGDIPTTVAISYGISKAARLSRQRKDVILQLVME